MQEKTIVKALREVEKDFASKKASLERDLKKKTQDVLEKMMTEFSRKLKEATIHLKGIPKRYRGNIGQQAVVRKFLKQLELSEEAAPVERKVRKGRKPTVSEAQILAFVATERTTEEIKKHFGGWSSPTFNKYLNPLIKAGKVSATPTRPKRYKQV